MPAPSGHTYPLLVTSGGHPWRPVQTCSLQDLPTPLVLTSSGGPTIKASGMYPTGMVSYFEAADIKQTFFARYRDQESSCICHRYQLELHNISETIQKSI